MNVNDLIELARGQSKQPNNSKAIVANLMFGKLWKKGDEATEIKRVVMREGYNALTRRYLKKIRENDTEAEGEILALQFELWPTAAGRELIRQIDEIRVFVPSRDDFVPLIPSEISRKETDEAGRYLVHMSRLVRLRGLRLIDLATIEDPNWI